MTPMDRAVLKAPRWGTSVVAYLFAGGVAGGLGIIAALADPREESGRRLRRTARVATLAVAAACPPILISHLGRPERFLHMLRTFNPRSPMSLGVWGLVAYSGVAGIAVLKDDDGLAVVQAVLGAFLAGYTGVLLGATAVPLWGAGKAHIPAASVCSGIASACALANGLCAIGGNAGVSGKIERFERLAAGAECAILAHFAATRGYGARRLVERVAPALAVALVAGLVHVPKRRATARTLVAAAATLTAGVVFRKALIDEGKRSAREPGAGMRQPR